MQKKLIVILCSVVVIVLMALLGCSVTMSLKEIKVSYSVYSEEAQADADEIQGRLDEFLGVNYLFFNTDRIQQVLGEYPYLAISSLEKVFPDSVSVMVEERLETYAVQSIDAVTGKTMYSVLDRTGVVIAKKETNINHLDGGANLLLTGFSFQSLTIGEKAVADQSFEFTMSACQRIDELVGGIRSNFKTLEIKKPTSAQADDYFMLQSAEGVRIKVVHPVHLLEEKVNSAIELYFQLTDVERLFGLIEVNDSGSDENAITRSYTSRNGTVVII